MAKIHLPEAGSDRFGSIDPLDGRYFDPEIARYLSERSRIAYQAHVEAALAQTLAEFGVCSRTAARAIGKATKGVTAEDVYAEEAITKHDIKALVNCIKRDLPASAQPYVHFGATSYDIISTATSLQLRTAIQELVLPRLQKLLETLLELTKVHAHTRQIGRTHGQHAIPVTFGFALAEYVARLGDSMAVLDRLSRDLRGKFSGAVGAYNALSIFVDNPVKFEKTLLDKLRLEPAVYSTQIVPPGPTIRLIDELAITAGIMANLSHDMRHLQRSEIAEVRERFEKGQTGSSTMAHKRNPWNFENIISMSKQVTAQIINANLNVSSEHQRDLTDSASSRFYTIPIASVAAMATRLNTVMGKLEVDEESMQRNLQLSGGAIAAEPLYLLLEKHGDTSAHEKAKVVSQEALRMHMPLHEAIKRDKTIARYWRQFTQEERQLIKNPEDFYIGQASQKALAVYSRYKKMV
ncbi:MAG TPA: lyase family protein [Candidatus Saccharimonadales bacterium]|nr:lyase family protein [Candidatus Saccharimonadales bacterium]